MQTKFYWLGKFAIATPLLLIIAVALMGGGHGWYEPAIILFPWGLVGIILKDGITIPFIILAIIQFPLYGLLFDIAQKSNRQKFTAISILSAHVFLTVFILIFRNSKWI